MTAPAETPGLADPPLRPVDLALARTHLRLGSLALARAELETLAGVNGLDGAGQVDLAEVRWRTGDLARAGEAATEALALVGDEPVALVVAAEAAAALGRPNEARRLAIRAVDCADEPIDAIFAGMPRSAVWPTDAAEPPPTAATLFHQEPMLAQARRAGDSDAAAASTLRAPAGEAATTGAASRAPVTPGFWDVDAAGDPATHELPDPAQELEAARRALVAGSLEEASLRFALTLRLAPALAPAVLEATEGGTGPALNLVRGDAFRLVGLETEARRAYATAAWSGSRDRRRARDEADQPAVSDTIPRVQRSRTQGRHARH
jgi:hypothetical protein